MEKQVGDIDHPWNHGVCACDCGDCIRSCCSPCTLYGRASYRLTHKDDPDMKNYFCLNASCLSWCGLCLVGCIPAVALQAARRFLIRQKLGIQGDPVKDCCTAFFCQTCAMLQDDVEVRDWQRRKAPYDRPSAPRQPAPFAPMSYPGQPHPNQQTAYPMQPYPQPAMHRGQNFDAGQATYGVAPSQPQPGYY